MNKKVLLILLTILSALALGACGSSSGGGGGVSASTCVWDNAGSTWDNCTWGP